MKLEVKAWLVITILLIVIAVAAIVLSIKSNKNSDSARLSEVSHSLNPSTSPGPQSDSSPRQSSPTPFDGSVNSDRFDWYPGR